MGNRMNRKRYSAFILATALLIIGMRGVCMAQYSEHVSIEKPASQECNDVQLSSPINTSTDFSQLVDKRMIVGFTFRVKKYVYGFPKSFVPFAFLCGSSWRPV
jgi:hypothetical protein